MAFIRIWQKQLYCCKIHSMHYMSFPWFHIDVVTSWNCKMPWFMLFGVDLTETPQRGDLHSHRRCNCPRVLHGRWGVWLHQSQEVSCPWSGQADSVHGESHPISLNISVTTSVSLHHSLTVSFLPYHSLTTSVSPVSPHHSLTTLVSPHDSLNTSLTPSVSISVSPHQSHSITVSLNHSYPITVSPHQSHHSLTPSQSHHISVSPWKSHHQSHPIRLNPNSVSPHHSHPPQSHPLSRPIPQSPPINIPHQFHPKHSFTPSNCLTHHTDSHDHIVLPRQSRPITVSSSSLSHPS